MKEKWFIPYKYKMVERIDIPSQEKRLSILEKAGYNLFNIDSKDVYIDLLTDSGTGTMSSKQWAEIMTSDESYAGSRSFIELRKSVREVFGEFNLIPVHQGRAAEKILNSVVIKKGDLVPGNSHFDTTKAHIETAGGRAIDLTIKESAESGLYHPFKGNIDLDALANLIKERKDEISYILLTVTCNSGGGQPVSLDNINATAKLAKDNSIPLVLDAARFAENAYFIKTREEKYKDWSIEEIVKQMFKNIRAFTMSSKKDAIVPMGGLLCVKDGELFESLKVPTILNEGFITYGGMSGMVMSALAQGLKEVTDFKYLSYRIGQIEFLVKELEKSNIPVVTPAGGHALFLDGRKFYKNIPQDQFPAQYLTTALYAKGGIRGVEVGSNLIGRDPDTGENIVPKLDLCRLAIPRRSYSYEHLMYIAETIKEIYLDADKVTSGFKIYKEGNGGIRHFTTTFKFVDPKMSF